MKTAPTYTRTNCSPAYQLNWSLTLFFRHPLSVHDWFDELKTVTEKDGVRILKHDSETPLVIRFFISSKPFINPQQIIRSIKGRFQYLIREKNPKAFKRNYSIISIGKTRGKIIEHYVANQLHHHKMVEEKIQKRFEEYQISEDGVDLLKRRKSSHGQFIYNIHLVLVHEGRWTNTDRATLAQIRAIIPKICMKKAYILSRLSLFADHMHMTLGCPMDESPGEVALSFLNGLTEVLKQGPFYKFSYYIGTFGPYDRGVVGRN